MHRTHSFVVCFLFFLPFLSNAARDHSSVFSFNGCRLFLPCSVCVLSQEEGEAPLACGATTCRDLFLVGGVSGRIAHSNLLPDFPSLSLHERRDASGEEREGSRWNFCERGGGTEQREERSEKMEERSHSVTKQEGERHEVLAASYRMAECLALQVLFACRNLQQTLRLGGAPAFQVCKEEEEGEYGEEKEVANVEDRESEETEDEDREEDEEEEQDDEKNEMVFSCYPPPLVFAFVSVPHVHCDALTAQSLFSSSRSSSSSFFWPPLCRTSHPSELSVSQDVQPPSEEEQGQRERKNEEGWTTVVKTERMQVSKIEEIQVKREGCILLEREDNLYRDEVSPLYERLQSISKAPERSPGGLSEAVRVQIQTHLSEDILTAYKKQKQDKEPSRRRKKKASESGNRDAEDAKPDQSHLFLHSPHRLFTSRFLSSSSSPPISLTRRPASAPPLGGASYTPHTSSLSTSFSSPPLQPPRDDASFPSPPSSPSSHQGLLLLESPSPPASRSSEEDCQSLILPSSLVVPALVKSVQGGGHVSLWPLGVLGTKRQHHGEENREEEKENSGVRRSVEDKKDEGIETYTRESPTAFAGSPWPFSRRFSGSAFAPSDFGERYVHSFELQEEKNSEEEEEDEEDDKMGRRRRKREFKTVRDSQVASSWLVLPGGRARGHWSRRVVVMPEEGGMELQMKNEEEDRRHREGEESQSDKRDGEHMKEEKKLETAKKIPQSAGGKAQGRKREDGEEQDQQEERREKGGENKKNSIEQRGGASSTRRGDVCTEKNSRHSSSRRDNTERKAWRKERRSLRKDSRGFLVTTEVTAQLGKEMNVVSDPVKEDESSRHAADWAAAVITLGRDCRPRNLEKSSPAARDFQAGVSKDEQDEEEGLGDRSVTNEAHEEQKNRKEVVGMAREDRNVEEFSCRYLNEKLITGGHQQGQRGADEEDDAINVLVGAIVHGLEALRRCTGNEDDEDDEGNEDCILYVLYLLPSDACTGSRDQHHPPTETLPVSSSRRSSDSSSPSSSLLSPDLACPSCSTFTTETTSRSLHRGVAWEKSFLTCLRRALRSRGDSSDKTARKSSLPASKSSLSTSSPSPTHAAPIPPPSSSLSHPLYSEVIAKEIEKETEEEEEECTFPVFFLPTLGLEGEGTYAQAVLVVSGGR